MPVITTLVAMILLILKVTTFPSISWLLIVGVLLSPLLVIIFLMTIYGFFLFIAFSLDSYSDRKRKEK